MEGEIDGRFLVNKIKEQKAFGSASGTETIDIPTSNYLNSLMLRVQNTNGSTSNTGETIATSITKLVVTADGVPVYSISGEMARVVEHFDNGKRLPAQESQSASAVQYAMFQILFGEDDNDKEFILPAHKFATLQLKIEYSFTDSTTAGWTTSASNAKYDLLSKILVAEELVDTPFIRKKEVYSKTLNTVQEETVDLPVGEGIGSYRRIFVRAYEGGIQDGVDIDKLYLKINDNQRVIDQRWLTSQGEDAIRYNAVGDKSVTCVVAAATATDYSSKCSNINAVNVTGTVADMVIGVDALAGDKISFDSENSAAEDVYVDIKSDGVPFATCLDLGTDEIEDSIDVGAGSGISSLKLVLNVAAAGAQTKVVTEEVVYFS